MSPVPPVIKVLDAYLDAAPRSGSEAIPSGPFTIFLARGPWGYYARPSRTRDPHHNFTAAEVTAVVDTQRAYEQFVALEWIDECDPSLSDACGGAGLVVTLRPLLTAAPKTVANPFLPNGMHLEVLGPDHPLLAEFRAVVDVAFINTGTAKGRAGVRERDACTVDQVAVGWMASRIASGSTIAVAAMDEREGIVGVGSAQPVVDLASGICAAELTGIGVLPSHRRYGIAAAITGALSNEAAVLGVEVLLLSAQSDDVARVYERVGFQRVATFAEASGGSRTRFFPVPR